MSFFFEKYAEPKVKKTLYQEIILYVWYAITVIVIVQVDTRIDQKLYLRLQQWVRKHPRSILPKSNVPLFRFPLNFAMITIILNSLTFVIITEFDLMDQRTKTVVTLSN